MKNFGLLKTKIENVLLESYANDTFKNELKTFKKLVIENNNISKLFYLYDELSSPKSLSESYCNDYINFLHGLDIIRRLILDENISDSKSRYEVKKEIDKLNKMIFIFTCE